MQSKQFKEHRGVFDDGFVIFSIQDNHRPFEDYLTGCVERLWQTGERTTLVTKSGEEVYFSGLMIDYVGTAGRIALSVLVQTSHRKLEDTLVRLKHLPDHGVDLSMVQPLFTCTLDRPAHGYFKPAALKFARIFKRDS